jgi:hypothetical protein
VNTGDYRVRIYHSNELRGLTGDKGETVCAFFHNYRNPLNSSWAWFFDEAQANEFIKKIREASNG